MLAPDVANPLTARMVKGVNTTADEGQTMIAHSLRSDGFDASEDGAGRGTPMVPVAFDCKAGANTGFAIGDVPGALRGEGHGGGHAAIAFSAKDHGADAMTDCSPTLRAGGHTGSHANAGVMPAVAFAQNQREEVRLMATAGALNAAPDVKRGSGTLMHNMQVRRLTPRECERLQGFPDDYTLIPLHNKRPSDVLRFAADGPRYKALGNSMAVPVMRWIGERIQAVDHIISREVKA